MLYAEATWDGYHFKHIVAYEEHQRLQRKRSLAIEYRQRNIHDRRWRIRGG